MTLFTSVDCFKKTRESSIAIGGREGGGGRERERERERRKGEETKIEEENIKGSRTLARGMKERVRASSAELEDAAGTDPIALLAGLKSILQVIVYNSDEKTAQ